MSLMTVLDIGFICISKAKQDKFFAGSNKCLVDLGTPHTTTFVLGCVRGVAQHDLLHSVLAHCVKSG